jgi:Fic family protein
MKLREKDRERVALMGRRSGNALVLLRWLYRTPIITVKGAQRATGLSRANANSLVAKFVESGVLAPVDAQVEYGRQFVHREYLNLFTSS